MPDESASSARHRFSRDLRRIRKEREVSLASLHAATQAPESQIEAFEEGALYGKSRMNDVYLKAFVRAYAEAIGLPPEPVVEHLEAALAGSYQNQLAAEYLDDPSLPDESPSMSEKDTSVPSGAEPGGGSTDSSESLSSQAEENASAEESGAGKKRRASSSSLGEGTVGGPEGGSDEAAVRDRPRRSSRSPSNLGGATESLPWKWLTLATTAFGLLVLIAWGVVSFTGAFNSTSSSSSETEGATSTVRRPMDTSRSTDATAPPDASAASEEEGGTASVQLLRDTMHVTVLATSPVRELRVQQDDDLRRPYWIKEGEALVFPFARRITLQNQLDSLRLFVNRYPFPTTYTDAEGRIVITRATVQQFADTLQGKPATISTSPDTVEIRTPASPAPDTTDGTG